VLVVVLAAQRASPDAPATSMAGGAPFAGGGGAGAPAPDISSMSPRERASRLFDRIMRLATEGKQDSVALFASMAIPAFEAIGPLDTDARYDLGRIAEVSGNLDLAAAQADTILRGTQDHLLGIILSARVAEARGNTTRRNELERRLLSVQAAELAKNLNEYVMHKGDIDAALEAARARSR
jgi:hypothetical protein